MICSGNVFFSRGEGLPYSLLRFLEPGLCLDLGAALGHTTCLMLNNSPSSRVIAFEPFPGNWPHYEAATRHLANQTLVRKAVCERSDEMLNFDVPSVIQGEDNSWGRFAGGSGVGFLSETQSPGSIKVETVRIDDIVKEHVLFMKIDIQGAEARALRGAQQTMQRHGIDLVYCEFDGSAGILDWLVDSGYVIFDDRFGFTLPAGGTSLDNWAIVEHFQLSTGVAAVKAWPRVIRSDPIEYARFVLDERERMGVFIWNDFLAVHRSALAKFLRAMASLIEATEGNAVS